MARQRFAAAERPQRAQHQMRSGHQVRAERQQSRQAQARVAQRQHSRHETRVAERQQSRHQAQARMTERQQARANRNQAQNRMAERQQLRPNAQGRLAQRQHERVNNVQSRMAARQELQSNRLNQARDRMAERQQIRGERQMASRNLLAERHALRADRIANANLFRTSRLARTLEVSPRVRFVAPSEAVRFVGQPVRNVTNFVTLAALPSSVSYLYPDTPDYYYRYGGGYLYEVDRTSSLISALIPLLAGGFLPGTYLPQPYMTSYVPAYYGLNSFYPATYGGYGYGYPNLCNRYAYGVVYQVDCYTGMVVNVIPTYAGGYGVGQLLPSAYSYYNVPMQYRSLYYPTADYSYWYAPGAIYQYDTSSSLITSVAALMSPGFTIGQPLPVGYGIYNVPTAYRSTYYDTPTAWYRYNNGYIYQVDPSTMLVTAMVASLLT
jgi:hypothetical protein